jgi:O-antigen/teichoic acid export membrane protein
MLLPLALQLAHGWTNLSLYKNVVSVILFIPLLVKLVMVYGSTGAAIAWIALNAGYFIFEVPVMHRYILKRDMWRWYFWDVGTPLLVTLCIALVSRLLMPLSVPLFITLVWIGLTGLLTLLLSALATSFTRRWLVEFCPL